MKPFIASLLTIAVIAIGADFYLSTQKMSAKDVFQSQSGNVRLGNSAN